MPKLSKLAEVMDAKAFTQEALAIKSGLSIRTVWSAQKGNAVSAVTAKAIAKATGMKPEELR